MNSLGIILIWCIAQVTVASLVGGAVYLVARRAGQGAGRLAAATSLAVVLVLTLATFTPWPSWLTTGAVDRAEKGGEATIAIEPLTTSSNVIDVPTETRAVNISPPILQDPAPTSLWRTLWAGLRDFESSAVRADAPARNAWRWPATIATLMLAAAAIGVMRLLLSGGALRRLAQRSKPIDDAQVHQLVRELDHEMGLLDLQKKRQPIQERRAEGVSPSKLGAEESTFAPWATFRRAPAHRSPKLLSSQLVVRESPNLQSAATFGWRLPIILLPKGWREWPRVELRAVLAHELAHVRSADFATWLFAQLAVAMHFYHPLVHWLAQRLRLEQELSADATAAALSGGRTTYLESLAALTLRADRFQVGWAAQAFLPTRTMFVRRIEMLKQTKTTGQERLGGRVRVAVIGALAAVGVLIAGLRVPGGNSAQSVAAETAAEQPADSKTAKVSSSNKNPTAGGYDFAYVPEGVLALIAIRPGQMDENEQLAPLIETFFENTRPSIPADAAEQITLVIPIPHKTDKGRIDPGTGGEYTIFRTNRAVDFEDRLAAAYGPMQTETHNSLDYLTWSPSPGSIAFHSPNDKTLLSRARTALFAVMDDPDAAKSPTQAAAWRGEANGPIFGVFNVDRIRDLFDTKNMNKLPGGFFFQMYAPLVNDVDRVFVTIDVGDEAVLKVKAICTHQEKVTAVERTIRSSLVLLGNLIATQSMALENRGDEEAHAIGELLSVAEKAVKNATLTSDGNKLLLKAPLGGSLHTLQAAIKQVQKARQSAYRQQSMNNLKQVALALHNYASVHKSFPPPVLYDKKTGTPYSWRVAILPYLEQNALRDIYRTNEPWDSEHNMKIANTRVPVFSSPADLASRNAAYFALVGPTTAFAGKDGVMYAQIRDGLSKTLMIVEAKRNIPWTKPEDIPYSHDEPLPSFGGLFEGGFNAAFCDGHVRFLTDRIDEKALRILIEKADGNRVDNSVFDR